MSLRLNILEQLIATEFDVGYKDDLTLIKNIKNPTTGLIEFNTKKKLSISNMPIEELVKSFYQHSGYEVSNLNGTSTISRFIAEKTNKYHHKYIITILKTPYQNSIFITQPE